MCTHTCIHKYIQYTDMYTRTHPLTAPQANWMFEVEKFDASKNEYTFGRGGNQGARGNNNGGDFYIQDVRIDINICVRARACVDLCARLDLCVNS